MNDADLEKLYQNANAADLARPSRKVRERILAHATNAAAARDATDARARQIEAQDAHENHQRGIRALLGARSRWQIAIPLAAGLVAAILLVPMRNVRVPPPAASRSEAAAPPASPAHPQAIEPASALPAPPPNSSSDMVGGYPPAAFPESQAEATPVPSAPSRDLVPAPGPPRPSAAAPAERALSVGRGRVLDESLANVVNAPAPFTAEQAGSSSPSSVARQANSPSLRSPALIGARILEAASEGDAAQVGVLAGENVSAVKVRDRQGRTPLMLAAMNRHLGAVVVLLAHGADPNAADHSGRTPLQVADGLGESSISDALRRAGAREIR